MDVTRILEADHREVEDLFGKIEKAEGADRASLIEELATALKKHMDLEEAVVYPAMEPVLGEEPTQENHNEHKLARSTLEELTALLPDEPGIGAAVDALKAGIEHHVKEEEEETFPDFRKKGPEELAEMATPFMHKRVELGLPIDADGLSAAANKDELVDEATKAGIDGASSMNKAELADALVAQMA